jgi:N-acetylglucosaminyldiphosphoundecaprenol N-acetyl-beta-D-mannosaminyltransferase
VYAESATARIEMAKSGTASDPDRDLTRLVYCVLGLPIDAVTMADVVNSIEDAVKSLTPLSLSTPNLNFLIASRDDKEFRESLLDSDLCPPDGMPIIWISHLLGLPIRRRIAGSDIFQALKTRPQNAPPIRLLFFGSTEAVASAAAKNINDVKSALTCSGWICPGFGTVEQMSNPQLLDRISSSGADFLVAALGARKGQLWLSRNRNKLRVPVQAHLGATINFQAGAIKRAPMFLQKLGLEWVWRIIEEPHLWSRYFKDGIAFLRLLVLHVVPLFLSRKLFGSRTRHDLSFETYETPQKLVLRMAGSATADNIQRGIDCFQQAVSSQQPVRLDFSQVSQVDARFLGLLLMFRKRLKLSGRELELTGIQRSINRAFRLHGVAYLLTSAPQA